MYIELKITQTWKVHESIKKVAYCDIRRSAGKIERRILG